ncbi:MAG: signal peptidase I [Alteromonadaceae bacterium]|nr:signal peptidase I [Alteromonadaceae bacterium]
MKSVFTLPLVLSVLFWGAMLTYLTDRFSILVPAQKSVCLKARFFIVDHYQTHVEKGDLAVFIYHKDAGPLSVGDKVIKKVAATGNDIVQLEQGELSVNGEPVATKPMQRMLAALGLSDALLTQHKILPSDEIFVTGETENSFDSRYWGTIKSSAIQGVGYAIL